LLGPNRSLPAATFSTGTISGCRSMWNTRRSIIRVFVRSASSGILSGCRRPIRASLTHRGPAL